VCALTILQPFYYLFIISVSFYFPLAISLNKTKQNKTNEYCSYLKETAQRQFKKRIGPTFTIEGINNNNNNNNNNNDTKNTN